MKLLKIALVCIGVLALTGCEDETENADLADTAGRVSNDITEGLLCFVLGGCTEDPNPE